MKLISTLLTAAIFAITGSATAQTTASQATAPAVTKPETTAPAPATTGAAEGGNITAAPAEPTLSPAAMRARASASHGAHGARGVAPAAKAAPGFKDGITMRDGKVIATESGHSTYLIDSTQTVKLITGLEARADGLVTRPDGTTETLKEGDYITITGRLTTAQERTAHVQSLKENLKEDRKVAAKKARSPLRQLGSGF